MARPRCGAKDKIVAGPYATRPKQHPTIRSLRIRCGAARRLRAFHGAADASAYSDHSSQTRRGKGGGWGYMIAPGELAAFGNPG